jgi:hypothetical protein
MKAGSIGIEAGCFFWGFLVGFSVSGLIELGRLAWAMGKVKLPRHAK